MKIGHRVRLVPTGEQETAFRRACGVSRFAYNWALSEWRLQSEAGEKPSGKHSVAEVMRVRPDLVNNDYDVEYIA